MQRWLFRSLCGVLFCLTTGWITQAEDVPQPEGLKRSLVVSGQGYFPVALRLKDDRIAIVLRGGAGHLGIKGRLDMVFSSDEENTMEMVLQGRVAGGGVSNQDYEELPEELKAQLVAFDRTIDVPRQLVSARPGLEPALVERVQALLMGLDQTEEGQQVLEALKKTTKFDAPPQEASSSLEELRGLIDLVSRN